MLIFSTIEPKIVGLNFVIQMHLHTITDINECDESHLYCGDNTECTNLNGAYQCECLKGFLSTADGNEYNPAIGCGKFLSSFSC